MRDMSNLFYNTVHSFRDIENMEEGSVQVTEGKIINTDKNNQY